MFIFIRTYSPHLNSQALMLNTRSNTCVEKMKFQASRSPQCFHLQICTTSTNPRPPSYFAFMIYIMDSHLMLTNLLMEASPIDMQPHYIAKPRAPSCPDHTNNSVKFQP